MDDRNHSPTLDPARTEQGLFELILELHPEHLTADELVREFTQDENRSEAHDVRDALESLRRSGLVRRVDAVISLTRAAVCAGQLLGRA
jgi:Fe2+ or Zn2+ uptake regulation protein